MSGANALVIGCVRDTIRECLQMAFVSLTDLVTESLRWRERKRGREGEWEWEYTEQSQQH